MKRINTLNGYAIMRGTRYFIASDAWNDIICRNIIQNSKLWKFENFGISVIAKCISNDTGYGSTAYSITICEKQ